MASIGDGRDVLTRLHRAHILQDVFGGGKADQRVARALQGGGARRAHLSARRHLGRACRHAAGGERSSSEAERTRQWREIGLGAQILRDLGVSSIRLLSSHERTYVGLSGFGIEIVKTEAVEG